MKTYAKKKSAEYETVINEYWRDETNNFNNKNKEINFQEDSMIPLDLGKIQK